MKKKKVTTEQTIEFYPESNFNVVHKYVEATAWSYNIFDPHQKLVLAIMLSHADEETCSFEPEIFYDKIVSDKYGIGRTTYDNAIVEFVREGLLTKKSNGEYKIDKDYFIHGVTHSTQMEMTIHFKFYRDEFN